MSDYEHLMENACCELERVRKDELTMEVAYQAFKRSSINITLSEQTGVSLDAAWQMANYVIFTWDLCK